jgi:hypothetical protein
MEQFANPVTRSPLARRLRAPHNQNADALLADPLCRAEVERAARALGASHRTEPNEVIIQLS